MNYAAVDAGCEAVVKVEGPAEWANIECKQAEAVVDETIPAFVRDVCKPIDALKGDMLPVSAFNGREDGTWDNGTAAYEKRGIATSVPEELPKLCQLSHGCRACCVTCLESA